MAHREVLSLQYCSQCLAAAHAKLEQNEQMGMCDEYMDPRSAHVHDTYICRSRFTSPGKLWNFWSRARGRSYRLRLR